MPVVARRPSAVNTETGETLLVYSEPSKYSIPKFNVYDRKITGSQTIPFLKQDLVWGMGSRITYFHSTTGGKHVGSATPILVFHRDSENSARPIPVTLLHNTVDPVIQYNRTTKMVHMVWWWNAWSPDFQDPWSPIEVPQSDPHKTLKLPQPPSNRYHYHCPPDEATPPWLRSIVPKRAPEIFDPRRPFWVAPLPDGHLYDYYPTNSQIIGESKVGGPTRTPDTPGSRLIQSMISRGLLDIPAPSAADFSSEPSDERDDWEKRGGIVRAGAHLREASQRDYPEFIPQPGRIESTNELEMEFIPGYDQEIPSQCTIEDHMVIINSLRAYYDNANLVNSTRVMMYARGRVIDDTNIETVPYSMISTNPITGVRNSHQSWPNNTERVSQKSFLLLDHPQVLGSFPVRTNYRSVINPDMVLYPVLGSADVSIRFFNDGFISDAATTRSQQDPAVDWSIQDPTPGAGTGFDIFRDVLDLKSY